ncbi:MAG: hypothetical protein CVU50_08150 [Candidatus Cloacimonetes bacterium HGW-Cloacimonetes-3]|jgi:hypothetical protein|nr:MAG: hypothetical protein CVU50_08150 [Candidatus Cloacimonetes bacterium HGW-Cloacimonetes-3]
MERFKLMPRHILLLALPVFAAMLGGLLTSGSLEAFMTLTGAKGISPSQFFFAVSLLVGALAFSWRSLPKSVTAAVVLFFPLVYSILMSRTLGIKSSLFLVYGLNLAFCISIALTMGLTFFSKLMIRIRTAAFAAIAALMQTFYFQILYLLLGGSYTKSSFATNFMSAFFLFIFIGFGLSIADIVIIRKEVEELRKERQRIAEDEEEDDI